MNEVCMCAMLCMCVCALVHVIDDKLQSGLDYHDKKQF
jgi:hypothetical protein